MAVGRPIKLTPNVARRQVAVTATSGQTSFTPSGGYRINELAVFRNGVRLVQGSDYTAVDGSTVTLQSGAAVDDIIEFVIFDNFNIADAIGANGNQTIGGDLVIGSGTTIYSSGIVSTTTLRADTLYGNGANLTGMASTEYIDAASITVSGIATCNGVLDANAEVTAAGGVDVAGGVKVGAALTVVGALDVDGVTTLDVLTAAEEVKVGSAVTIGTAGVSTFSNGVNLAPGTGLLREKFSSTTTAWSNNNTDLNLDNGMVQYSSGNLGGSSSTLNITSSVGINTQMAVGEMIIVTGITSCNSTSSYVNALKIDHTTVQVAWVGGSAPSDGGGSGFDTYTFNIWKTASATYNVIGNHVKTS